MHAISQTLTLEIISSERFISLRGPPSSAQSAGRARRAPTAPASTAAPRARTGGAGAESGARLLWERLRLSCESPRAPPGPWQTAAACLGQIAAKFLRAVPPTYNSLFGRLLWVPQGEGSGVPVAAAGRSPGPGSEQSAREFSLPPLRSRGERCAGS